LEGLGHWELGWQVGAQVALYRFGNVIQLNCVDLFRRLGRR
jgi:hypothetical protein